MALPLRSPTLHLRSLLPSTPTSLQTTRGAKRLSRPTGLTTAKLLKDLPTFGRAGSLVPIPTGQMRNRFFPLRIADYVSQAELRAIKFHNIPVERDYTFGKEGEGDVDVDVGVGGVDMFTGVQQQQLERRGQKSLAAEVEKVSPERSLQLLEIFINPRLDFYRQPLPPAINTEVEVEAEAEAEVASSREKSQKTTAPAKEQRLRTASSAAADLLEARTTPIRHNNNNNNKPVEGPQGIYGSVSAQDVLVAIRAATAVNDEAARVALREEDIVFLDQSVGRAVKFTGDYTVEIRVKGAERGVKRTVRVIGQEAV